MCPRFGFAFDDESNVVVEKAVRFSTSWFHRVGHWELHSTSWDLSAYIFSILSRAPIMIGARVRRSAVAGATMFSKHLQRVARSSGGT